VGWVAKHGIHIKRLAEGAAVGLVVMVAIGNGWVFLK
jgi:hypothetical protein